MPDPTKLTETGIDNFKIFVKFLAERDLLDQVTADLKSKGHEKIQVSIEVVQDIQAFLRTQFTAKADKAADMVIQSAHNNNF
jgi:hypothetical protein